MYLIRLLLLVPVGNGGYSVYSDFRLVASVFVMIEESVAV